MHLSQVLVNNGKVSKYLEKQLASNKGNSVNVLNVIHAIETGYKHAFMKNSGKLKMFEDLEVYHHHVNWDLLNNTVWAMNNDKELAPQWKNILDAIATGNISSAADAVEQSDGIITKAIGVGATHKTGQWLIYVRHESINYYIGVFDHINDTFTLMEQQLEKQHIGKRVKIILTDANNGNKPYLPEEQKALRIYLKRYNEEKLKKEVNSIIMEEFSILYTSNGDSAH